MAQQQGGLPDANTAYSRLFDGIHQQVFFHKMASYGCAPESPEQAAAMLEGAIRLRHIEEQMAYKQAQDASDPFVAANQYLAGLMGEQQPVYKQAEAESAISDMAADLMQNPEFYNSVLSLKAAEAGEYARNYGQ